MAKDTVIRIIAIENEILTSWTEAELGLYIELTERYLSLFKEKIKEL